MLGIGIIAAFITLAFFSIGDTLAKNVSVALGSHRTALYIVIAGALPITIAFLLFPPASITYTVLAIAAISAIFLTVGYILVYISLRTEQASNTWALINISPASLIIFGIFFLAEPVNALQEACIVAIVVGALMVTVTKEMKFNRHLAPAVIGNICFAAFIVIAAYGISTYSSDFTIFFFVPRVIAILLLLLYSIYQPKSFHAAAAEDKAPRLWGVHPRRVAVISGIFDGAAQVAYILVIMSKVVAVGSAITAAEPMLVIVLSYLLYKERLTKLQSLGVVISVLGAIAISII